MALTSGAFRKLSKEIAQLAQSPPDGIRLSYSEEDILDFTGWIAGPVGTPYEGGYFAIKIMPTHEYPTAPPKCWFSTKIFHPNVNESTGEICVSTLKKDWQPDFGVGHILQTVKCLLIAPNPESALNEEAGKMLLERYEDYKRHALLMTSIHATRQPSDVQPFTSAPVASTSKLADEKPRSVSPEVSFPTLPLQASHSTNSINEDASASSASGPGLSPGNRKRPLSTTLSVPVAPSEAPEPKKAATGAPKKKVGLRRL